MDEEFERIKPDDFTAYVAEPKRINPILRAAIRLTEFFLHKKLLPARILAWYPKTLISSGILESLVAHKDKNLSRRMLKLVRVQTSFAVSCPFCIDMNSFKYKEFGITDDELLALQGLKSFDEVGTFSQRELIALEYARAGSSSPLAFEAGLIKRLKENFSDREIVILASTIAQVNYWGRLIQSLGIPIAGFNQECSVLNLENYRTLKEENSTGKD